MAFQVVLKIVQKIKNAITKTYVKIYARKISFLIKMNHVNNVINLVLPVMVKEKIIAFHA